MGQILVLAREEISEFVDPLIGSQYSVNEVTRTVNLALLCTVLEISLRPTILTAVRMLEGEISISPPKQRQQEQDVGQETSWMGNSLVLHYLQLKKIILCLQ